MIADSVYSIPTFFPKGDTKMKAMNMHQQSGLNALTQAGLCTADGPVQSWNSYSGEYGQHGTNAGYLQLSTLADGTIVLDAEAAAGLVYMIEEEKMARDLYDAFFEQTGSVVFDRISDSEQTHMDTLLAVAENAGIDISGVSTTAGVFSDASIQSLYDTLLAQGSVSPDAAYEVGVLVEQTDIADLQNYSSDTEIGIVGTIYAHLEVGSEHHLAAFTQYAALV
jgi:hypothetical protein